MVSRFESRSLHGTHRRAAPLRSPLTACTKIPAGRSAVDDVTIRGTHALDEDDVDGAISTEASPKFLGVARGIVYDYEVFDRATLQRDLARIERYYRARGYYGAHARAGRVLTHGTGARARRDRGRRRSAHGQRAAQDRRDGLRSAGDAASAARGGSPRAAAGDPVRRGPGRRVREGGAQGADRRRLRVCDRDARHVHRHRPARREHHPHGHARPDGSPRLHHLRRHRSGRRRSQAAARSRSAPCGAPSISRRANPTRRRASTRPPRPCWISTSSRR